MPVRSEDAADLATIFYRSVREVARQHYSEAQVEAWGPHLGNPGGWNSRATDGRITIVAVNDADKPIAFGDMEINGHIDHLFSIPETLGTGAASAIDNSLESQAREFEGTTSFCVEFQSTTTRWQTSLSSRIPVFDCEKEEGACT